MAAMPGCDGDMSRSMDADPPVVDCLACQFDRPVYGIEIDFAEIGRRPIPMGWTPPPATGIEVPKWRCVQPLEPGKERPP